MDKDSDTIVRDISTGALERSALAAAYAAMRGLRSETDRQKVMHRVLDAYAAVRHVAREADTEFRLEQPEGGAALRSYLDERHIVATAFWAAMEGVEPRSIQPYASIGAQWSGFAAACIALNAFGDFAVALDGEQSGANLAQQVLEHFAAGC